MRKIKTETEYQLMVERIEELLQLVDNNTPIDDKNFVELDLLSDLVADYEETEMPVSLPGLIDVIQLRMYEMGLSQKTLAELLNISAPRVSEYLSGKSEPTLKVAREISKKLNISADIVLGV